MTKTNSVLNLAALGMSAAALVLAVIIALQNNRPVDTAALEQKVYDRFLAEAGNELRPVFRDFNVTVPDKPRCLADLLHPLLFQIGKEGDLTSPATTQP